MPIKTGQSTEKDQDVALREVVAQIDQAEIAFILLFCSVRYDLDALSRGISGAFPSTEFTLASATVTGAQARDGHAMRAIFIDGLSGMEEHISQACQSEFGDIPVVGGSSGDDERSAATYILHGGASSSRSTGIPRARSTLVPLALRHRPRPGFARRPENQHAQQLKGLFRVPAGRARL